ncbi:lipopolysaccharide biosynthesis protein [Aliivibrio sp. 1S128]|uniref:lipopolysaccharide biosynthesis protein n=1 Tax=Aliivibrio sp. 1S128 TaxID=1840085 RepID=UPI00080E2D8B|nr:oligosaccharide flippase family protein [Aliivibrio sp. 1S128]OCH19783.1 lipopolysaccharide biosynthesis protein [Aliivibrio sp. 1S128]
MDSLKQPAYYAVGILMMKGISLIMIPYITHKMTLEEYGSLESLILLADIGTILFGFGIVDAMYRYVGVSKGEEKRKLISNCFTLSVFVCLAGGFLMLISLPALLMILPVKFSAYQIGLLLIPTMLDGVISIPLTLLRMNAMAKRFCFLNVFKGLLQALMTFCLLEAGYGIDGVLISGAVSSIMLLLCLLGYQWKEMGRFGHLKSSKLVLSFGLPVLVGGASVYMINGLDRWFLASFVGVEELAVYAVSAKFALILGLILQPYALWWFPNRIAIFQSDNSKQQCAEKSLLGVNLGVVMGTFLILTAPGVITLLLPSSYSLAGTISVVLLTIGMIKNAGDYLNFGCYSGSSSHSQMWVQGLCAVVAVAGYFVITPIYGLWGVVGVLATAYTLRLVLLYMVSQSMEYLPYDHVKWIICIVIALLAITLNHILNRVFVSVPDLVLGILVSVVALLSFIMCGIIPFPKTGIMAFKQNKNSLQ